MGVNIPENVFFISGAFNLKVHDHHSGTVHQLLHSLNNKKPKLGKCHICILLKMGWFQSLRSMLGLDLQILERELLHLLFACICPSKKEKGAGGLRSLPYCNISALYK
jgi:hypothetical protein